MMPKEKRTDKFKKNESTEDLLKQVNEHLESLEKDFIENETLPELPVIFIVGAQRSGTTVLMQLLTQAFKFAYPNNFIARFWKSPYIGATIFQNLPVEEVSELKSNLGYTKGIMGPHEFGYFWKRWYPWEPGENYSYDQINYALMLKQLAAWQKIANKPLIFKNLVQVSNHIKHISNLIPNAYFINIVRDDFYAIQSTYLSRINLYASEKPWLGVKPSNFRVIKKIKNPLEQITHQIFSVKKEIKEQLITIQNDHVITISYEELISDPSKIIDLISRLFEIGAWRDLDFSLKEKLINGNINKLNQKQTQKIKDSICAIKN